MHFLRWLHVEKRLKRLITCQQRKSTCTLPVIKWEWFLNERRLSLIDFAKAEWLALAISLTKNCSNIENWFIYIEVASWHTPGDFFKFPRVTKSNSQQTDTGAYYRTDASCSLKSWDIWQTRWMHEYNQYIDILAYIYTQKHGKQRMFPVPTGNISFTNFYLEFWRWSNLQNPILWGVCLTVCLPDPTLKSRRLIGPHHHGRFQYNTVSKLGQSQTRNPTWSHSFKWMLRPPSVTKGMIK